MSESGDAHSNFEDSDEELPMATASTANVIGNAPPAPRKSVSGEVSPLNASDFDDSDVKDAPGSSAVNGQERKIVKGEELELGRLVERVEAEGSNRESQSGVDRLQRDVHRMNMLGFINAGQLKHAKLKLEKQTQQEALVSKANTRMKKTQYEIETDRFTEEEKIHDAFTCNLLFRILIERAHTNMQELFLLYTACTETVAKPIKSFTEFEKFVRSHSHVFTIDPDRDTISNRSMGYKKLFPSVIGILYKNSTPAGTAMTKQIFDELKYLPTASVASVVYDEPSAEMLKKDLHFWEHAPSSSGEWTDLLLFFEEHPYLFVVEQKEVILSQEFVQRMNTIQGVAKIQTEERIAEEKLKAITVHLTETALTIPSLWDSEVLAGQLLHFKPTCDNSSGFTTTGSISSIQNDHLRAIICTGSFDGCLAGGEMSNFCSMREEDKSQEILNSDIVMRVVRLYNGNTPFQIVDLKLQSRNEDEEALCPLSPQPDASARTTPNEEAAKSNLQKKLTELVESERQNIAMMDELIPEASPIRLEIIMLKGMQRGNFHHSIESLRNWLDLRPHLYKPLENNSYIRCDPESRHVYRLIVYVLAIYGVKGCTSTTLENELKKMTRFPQLQRIGLSGQTQSVIDVLRPILKKCKTSNEYTYSLGCIYVEKETMLLPSITYSNINA